MIVTGGWKITAQLIQGPITSIISLDIPREGLDPLFPDVQDAWILGQIIEVVQAKQRLDESVQYMWRWEDCHLFQP
jgi:hypothetical protein